jgi:hypothetical protein
MEKSIQKLFGILQDGGQEPFYNLAIKQLVEIHSSQPICLLRILDSATFLMHSRAKEATLRLRHRQMFAALVERALKNTDRDVQVFLSDEEKEDIQYVFGMAEPVPECRPEPAPEAAQSPLEAIQLDPCLSPAAIDFRTLMASECLSKGLRLEASQQQQRED